MCIVIDHRLHHGRKVLSLDLLDKETFLKQRRIKRNLDSRDLSFMDGNAGVIYKDEGLTQDRKPVKCCSYGKEREAIHLFMGKKWTNLSAGEPRGPCCDYLIASRIFRLWT